MILVISPAKILNLKPQNIIREYTQPDFLQQAAVLVGQLKQYSPDEIARLMEVNYAIAQTNVERYARWQIPFTPDNAKQSILTFNGEVYNGLKASSLTRDDFRFAQRHLRILSGLYGVLRPLDLMQPYRLSMGTPLHVSGKDNLYNFWGGTITQALDTAFPTGEPKVLINLASDEYFRSINTKNMNARIINIEFKEWSGSKYKTIVVYTKKARGLMCRFAIQHRLTNPEDLKAFNDEDYLFEKEMSDENNWVFIR